MPGAIDQGGYLAEEPLSMGTAGWAEFRVGGEGISEWKLWLDYIVAPKDPHVLISGACECYPTGQGELCRCHRVKDLEMPGVVLGGQQYNHWDQYNIINII